MIETRKETTRTYDESFAYHLATEYWDRGWSVIPLREKRPAVPWKSYQERRATLGEVAVWFGANAKERLNVGIVTGRISGLVVVDCDTKDAAEFCLTSYPTSPLVVETGRGGAHVYYQFPADSKLGNRTRIGGKAMDLRAEGGYVVAPPSRHENGNLYSWTSFGDYSLDEIPVFDEAWIQASKPAEPATRVPAVNGIKNPAAYIRRIHAVAGSGGHNATFRAACMLRDSGLRPEEALSELIDWNETNAQPPWSLKELLHKVQSAFSQKVGNV